VLGKKPTKCHLCGDTRFQPIPDQTKREKGLGCLLDGFGCGPFALITAPLFNRFVYPWIQRTMVECRTCRSRYRK